MKSKIRPLSVFLAVLILLSCLPMTAFAENIATIEVMVPNQKTITVPQNPEHGTVVLVAPTPPCVGDTVSLTAIPDTGYLLSYVKCNGVDVTAQMTDGTYTMTLTDDVVFEVKFAPANTAVLPGSVTVEDGKIQSEGDPIEVKTISGEEVPADKLNDVAEAINGLLDNSAVEGFTDTGIDNATKDSNGQIVEDLKVKTDDSTAKAAITETNISKYLDIDLLSVDVDIQNTVTLTAVEFDVTPMATTTVTGEHGSVTLRSKITNDEITAPVTFRLPVDKSNTADTAALYHEAAFMGNCTIQGSAASGKYIETSSRTFSKFSYITLNEKTAGVMVGSTLYASLSDAISSVPDNQTITLLKDASGTITVSREVTFTVDNNGNANTTTIVAGKDYKLSKSGNTYTVTKITGECVHTETVKLTENGTYGMKLNCCDKGEFTFTKLDGGWSIYNGSKYLAMQDGKLKLSDSPFAWTYKNGAFSASVTTEQKSGGHWFLFWYVPGRGCKTVTTTYYLSTIADGAKLSTCCVCAELYTTISGEHDFGCWIDCKDGVNHKHICKYCGKTETDEHHFDFATHKCIECGAYDPSATSISVTATYATKAQKQSYGLLGWLFGKCKTVTTYTATVKVNAEGLKATKVEVSADQKCGWTKSNTFTSNSEIGQFFVRVTTSDGTKHLFKVLDGVGIPVN